MGWGWRRAEETKSETKTVETPNKGTAVRSLLRALRGIALGCEAS